MPSMIDVAYFGDWFTQAPTQLSLSWEDFANDLLGSHQTAGPDKKRTPAISTVRYRPGTTRGAENVEHVSALGLDYDSLSEADAEKVLEWLQAHAYVMYTTYSHAKKRWSFRVFVQLDQNVPAAQWLGFWSRIQAILPVPSDKSCKDTSRLYGMPCAPAEELSEARRHVNPGVPIPVAQVMALPDLAPQIDSAKPKASKVDRRHALDIARRYSRQKNQTRAQVGRYLVDMLNGNPWTLDQGTRHDTMLQMTQVLERELSTVSPAGIAELFAQAMIQIRATDPSYDPPERQATAERAITDARRKRLEAEHQKREAADYERRKNIRAARGDGKDEPYNEDDKARLAALAGCEVADLTYKWVIFKRGAYYVLTLEGYKGPHSREEVMPMARDYLLPAGVETWTRNKDGKQVPVPLPTLLQVCASAFEGDIISDMTTEVSYVDERGTLHEACCKVREVEEVYDPQINDFLTVLGGAHSERLKDWMATATDMTRPTCAIYVHGEKDTGKSLLPALVGRLFRGVEGATDMSSVFHDFNSALADCPIVNADECWPKKMGKTPTSADIRNFITASSRPLRRKGIPETGLKGCIRLIVGANNMSLLGFGDEDLTPLDRDAINQRFLVLDPGAAMVEWFARNGLDRELIQAEWLDRDRFAKHVAWLRKNRHVEYGSKLIVQGNAPDFAAAAATTGGVQEDVTQWLVDMVQQVQPGKHIDMARGQVFSGQIFLDDRGLWVTSLALMSAVEHQAIKGRFKITPATAGKVLKSLSVANEEQRRSVKISPENGAPKKQLRFTRINTDFLIQYMRTNSYGDPDAFAEVMKNPGVWGEHGTMHGN